MGGGGANGYVTAAPLACVGGGGVCGRGGGESERNSTAEQTLL